LAVDVRHLQDALHLCAEATIRTDSRPFRHDERQTFRSKKRKRKKSVIKIIGMTKIISQKTIFSPQNNKIHEKKFKSKGENQKTTYFI